MQRQRERVNLNPPAPSSRASFRKSPELGSFPIDIHSDRKVSSFLLPTLVARACATTFPKVPSRDIVAESTARREFRVRRGGFASFARMFTPLGPLQLVKGEPAENISTYRLQNAHGRRCDREGRRENLGRSSFRAAPRRSPFISTFTSRKTVSLETVAPAHSGALRSAKRQPLCWAALSARARALTRRHLNDASRGRRRDFIISPGLE